MDALAKKIADAEAVVESLKKEQALKQKQADSLRRQGRDYYMAVALHDILCRLNHTDGCEWLYELDRSNGFHDFYQATHKEWLKRSRAIIQASQGMTDEEILEFVRLCR